MTEEAILVNNRSQETGVRVGVLVCDCGKKIAGVIDTHALAEQIENIPGVVYVRGEGFPCSRDGQERLLQAITEHKLDRVLVAGCSPRLTRHVFRKTGQRAGLARSFVNMANIREQCTYVHPGEPKMAFNKALGLVEMGVARLCQVSAETPRSGNMVKAALLIGSDISALTLAQSLADAGIPITIVEHNSGFGEMPADDLRKYTRQQTFDKGQALLKHPLVNVVFNAQVLEVAGHPGEYRVRLYHKGQESSHSVGAIIVANSARPKTLGNEKWFDRERVKTQDEFESELEEAAHSENGGAETGLPFKDIVFVLCAEKSQAERCSRVCCNIGIRQAMRAKQLNPDANVTVLFRDLYLGSIGSDYENELLLARKLGITFFRYRKERPPIIGSHSVDLLDTLTQEPLRVPFDRVVLSMPLVPQDNTTQLSALLGLPVDEDGFLAEPRTRLRPGRYAEPGIYAMGSAQQPADTDEALFQAYLTSSRVKRFLNRDSLKIESPAATIDATLCTGCGNCTKVCPVIAVHLETRDGVLSRSEVDPMRCLGCGNCVVVCPVKAIALPGWDTAEIPVQISAALNSRTFLPGAPRILVLACEWSAYGAADLAGVRHMPYPANVRIIRTNCSARFDPYHILWAFLNGADGVYLGTCPPGECHYSNGNLFAQERMEVLKSELSQHGFDPRRLHLEFLSVDDGQKFVKTLEDFTRQIQIDERIRN